MPFVLFAVLVFVIIAVRYALLKKRVTHMASEISKSRDSRGEGIYLKKGDDDECSMSDILNAEEIFTVLDTIDWTIPHRVSFVTNKGDSYVVEGVIDTLNHVSNIGSVITKDGNERRLKYAPIGAKFLQEMICKEFDFPDTLSKIKQYDPIELVEENVIEEPLPTFQYHTDPIKNRVIIKEIFQCPCCGKVRRYKYTGPFYTRYTVDAICPWCIADGAAADTYEGSFADYCGLEGISPFPDVPDEIKYKDVDTTILTSRTPSYISWQEAQWLGHCNEPCSFEGYVGWKEIVDLGIDVTADIEKLSQQYGMSSEEFCQNLFNRGDMQGYLFKCVQCGTYRLAVDCS